MSWQNQMGMVTDMQALLDLERGEGESNEDIARVCKSRLTIVSLFISSLESMVAIAGCRVSIYRDV